MTSTWMIILTFLGIRSFMAERVRLENAVVKATPKVIIAVLRRLLVTASVEQIPSIWMKMGLLVQRLSLRIAMVLLICHLPQWL